MVVDAILQGQINPSNAFELIGNYDGYLLPSKASPEGNLSLMLAPDSQRRKLAAIFTTPDSAEVFKAFVTEQLGFEPVLRQTSGLRLYKMLTETDLEGIVFNCKGPGQPKAVALNFAQTILDNQPTKS